MANTGSNPIRFSLGREGLLVQEEKLEIRTPKKKLVIGIPKELENYESRVSLTPEAVEVLVNNGDDIIIESDAGKAANYSNKDYSERGGRIVTKRSEVFEADIILTHLS